MWPNSTEKKTLITKIRNDAASPLSVCILKNSEILRRFFINKFTYVKLDKFLKRYNYENLLIHTKKPSESNKTLKCALTPPQIPYHIKTNKYV